jgi:nucleoside-diphosphate-sugar epimerase
MTAAWTLVTGASGFVGRPLVDRLVARGTPVVVLTRKTHASFGAGVRVHVGDLSTGQGVSPALFTDVATVFHCAGEIKDESRMQAVHVDGTARLLDAVAGRTATMPLRWVQASSVGAYGPPRNATERRVIDETSPEAPVGTYEQTKTASDALVRKASTDSGLTWSLLRPTAVIGAAMPNNSVRALIAMVRRGWFVYPGPADAIANYVHIDDVVEALLACGDHPHAAGETFIVSSDCPWTALVTEMAAALGVAPPAWRLPHGLVSAGARVAGALGAPLTVNRVNALAGRTTYSSARIERMLGFQVSRPLPQSVRDLIGAGR